MQGTAGRVRRAVPALATAAALTFLAGCSTAVVYYPYLIVTKECNCPEYRTRDGAVEYRFRAHYSMQDGIVTRIEIELLNRSRDTLSLELGSVRVSSLNVSYQYNNRFVPLPHLTILPHDTDVVDLTGHDVSGADDWLLIAGERLTVTTRGLRLGERRLKDQEVTFVPENPKLKRETPPP